MATTSKISPASTMPLSMRCSPGRWPQSRTQHGPVAPARQKEIRWFMISTGTRTHGSTNGGGVLRQTQDLPAVLQAIVTLDAWNELSVLQHAPWLGRLLSASILRQAGVTTGTHLAAINLGLKTIPVDRRRHRDRETRLLAITQGFLAAAEIGMKEHDRLTLAKTMMDRKLGRTANVLKIAGAGRAGDGKTAGVGRDGGEDAGRHSTGGAADCFGAGSAGDDGEGEVSGMACDLGSKSDTANYKVAPSGEPRLQKQV